MTAEEPPKERWQRSGLPEQCPECAESQQLTAYIEAATIDVASNGLDQIHRAEINCEHCGHEWGWQYDAESDTDGGE